MNLNKENMRKLKELILFTIIILIALWNYRLLFEWAGAALRIILPFILGGGIAFILNIPMSFLEEKIFKNRHLKEKKIAQKLARPVSLVLTCHWERPSRHSSPRRSVSWRSYLQIIKRSRHGFPT